MSRIESNRRALDARPGLRKWASPALYGLEVTVAAALQRHARGEVLDVGCGSMPYRDLVLSVASSYTGLDVEKRHDDVTYVASATDMHPVPSQSHDTVLCSEVLEHLDRPDRALAEISRVLRPGGRLVLTVPFLGRLHEEPHDYARYTEHGLRVLLDRSGFETVSIVTTGSIASFLGHQVSTAVVGGTWHVPVLKWLAYAVNASLVVAPCRMIDAIVGPMRRKLPLGYVVVARRSG